ncbi:MAG: hypothetical protein L3J10_07620 [Sulfurimonas sp.]|nr:hypothetical protein [Sulfurimonas sp.]
MKKSGFTLNSIPKDKELVALRMINSTASGGTFKDLTQDIHPDNMDISIRAAKLFGLGIAGIDIITTDIKKSWYDTGAIINEVNLAPLLGRNEISKRNLCTFYKYMMSGNGRIPINIFIGGNKAMSDAIKEQNSLIGQGIACYLTTHKTTISQYKSEMVLPFVSIYKRFKALLLNTQVQALILVIQTDEFLYTGLPIDKINMITDLEEDLVSSKNINKKLSQDRVNELLNLLESSKG